MKAVSLIIALLLSLLCINTVMASSTAELIDANTAKQMVDCGVLFVDVRSATSFKYGRIPGAINIDVRGKNFETEFTKAVKKDQEVVIYCRGVGCSRSPRAISIASSLGYEKIFYFEEGIPGWKNAGYKLEK